MKTKIHVMVEGMEEPSESNIAMHSYEIVREEPHCFVNLFIYLFV